MSHVLGSMCITSTALLCTELDSWVPNPPFSLDASYQLQNLRNTKVSSMLTSAIIFPVFNTFTHTTNKTVSLPLSQSIAGTTFAERLGW